MSQLSFLLQIKNEVNKEKEEEEKEPLFYFFYKSHSTILLKSKEMGQVWC